MHGRQQANTLSAPISSPHCSTAPSVENSAKSAVPEPVWTRVEVWREVRPLQEEIDRLRAELKNVQSDSSLAVEKVTKTAACKEANLVGRLEDEEATLSQTRLALQLETDQAMHVSNALEETRTEAAKESAAAYKGRAEGVQVANLVRASRAKLNEEESSINQLRSHLEEQETLFYAVRDLETEESNAVDMERTKASEELAVVLSLRLQVAAESNVASLAEDKVSQLSANMVSLESVMSVANSSSRDAEEEIRELLHSRDVMQKALESCRLGLEIGETTAKDMTNILRRVESHLESEALLEKNTKQALLATQIELADELQVLKEEREIAESSRIEATVESNFARLEFESVSLARSGLAEQVNAAHADQKETTIAIAERREMAIEANAACEERDASRHLLNDARVKLTEEVLVVDYQKAVAQEAESEVRSIRDALRRVESEAESEVAMKERLLASMFSRCKLEEEEISYTGRRVSKYQAELEAETDLTAIEKERSREARCEATLEEKALIAMVSKMEEHQNEIGEYAKKVHDLNEELMAETAALQDKEEMVRIAELDAGMREAASSALYAEGKLEQEEFARRMRCLRHELVAAGDKAKSDRDLGHQLTEQVQILRDELAADRDMACAGRDAASALLSKLSSEESAVAQASAQLTHENLEAKLAQARFEEELALQMKLERQLFDEGVLCTEAQKLLGVLQHALDDENHQMNKVMIELANETESAAQARFTVAEQTQEITVLHGFLQDEADEIRQLRLLAHEQEEQTSVRSLPDASTSSHLKNAWSIDGTVSIQCESTVTVDEPSGWVATQMPLAESVCKLKDSCSLDALFLRTQLTWEQESRAAQAKEVVFLQHRVKELEDLLANLRCSTSCSLPRASNLSPRSTLDVERRNSGQTHAGLNMSPNGAQILPPLPPRHTPPPPSEESSSISHTMSAGLVAYARLRRSFCHSEDEGYHQTGPPPTHYLSTPHAPSQSPEGKRRLGSPAPRASPRLMTRYPST